MYIAALPVWGRRYVNATHKGHSQKLFDEQNAKSYGEFVGKRFQSSSNIIWVLGGDVKAVEKNHNVDKRSVYRNMAEGIAQGVTGKNVSWDEPDPAWDQVLMTYHPSGTPLVNSSDWFHSDPWLDFNMIETHINRDQVYRAVSKDYKLENPVKPTVMGEPNYEGHTNKVFAGAIHVRRQAYQTFFAGAAGFTYGAFSDKPKERGPLFSPFDDWKRLLDLEGAQALPILREFLIEQHWNEWIPDADLVIENEGKGEKRIVCARIVDKNKVLVYFPENRRAKIKLPEYWTDRDITLTWFNTSNGETSEAKKKKSSQFISLKPQEDFMDAVAIIECR